MMLIHLHLNKNFHLNGGENSVEFSRDGTKIFALDQTASSPTVTTFCITWAL